MQTFPGGNSAQQAELFALTEDCIITQEKAVSPFTDSHHAFGMVDSFPASSNSY